MNIAAIRRFAAGFDPDPRHSDQVAKTALALFDALGGLHGLDAEARGLLHAAALLHDVGYSQDPASHHKRSRDIIIGSAFQNVSPTDLAIIACVARYHRKTLPHPRHKTYRDLDAGSRALVDRLAAILRIADGLDRSHACSARSLRVTRKPRTVVINVNQQPPAPADIQAALKRADLFERVFAVRVQITLPVDTGVGESLK